MLSLRIFLASPADVTEERRLAIDTIRELEESHLLRDRVNLQVVAWDDPAARAPLDARETPQHSVQRYAGRPADCDLTLAILWSRLGTPLPEGTARADGSRFASGTVWEVEDALAADRPVFVYRRTEKPRIDLDDPQFPARRAQYDALTAWFAAFERSADGALRAGVNDYATPAEFRLLLRQHLEAFIGQRLNEARAAAGTTPEPPAGPSANSTPTPIRSPGLAAASPDRRRLGWAAAGAGLIVAALLAWRLWPSPPPIEGAAPTGPQAAPTAHPAPAGATAPAPAQAQHTAGPQAPPAAAAATPVVPGVRLPEQPVVRFAASARPMSITLLAADATAGTSTHWVLTLRLRMSLPDTGGDANFGGGSFRLLQDGVPRAPNNFLNEIVARGTSKDGELVYEVPHGTQALVLRVWHYGDSADLPLVVEGAGPPAPAFAYPPGPRRVLVDGPDEVTFTRGSRVGYRVLATGTESRRPGVLGLRVRLRMTAFDAGGGANFWDSSFRLVVDGDSRAPDSNLNEVVGARAAKDGEVSFELPADARTAVLRIRRSDTEVAELPLRFEPVR